jgi:hypothetical protein
MAIRPVSPTTRSTTSPATRSKVSDLAKKFEAAPPRLSPSKVASTSTAMPSASGSQVSPASSPLLNRRGVGYVNHRPNAGVLPTLPDTSASEIQADRPLAKRGNAYTASDTTRHDAGTLPTLSAAAPTPPPTDRLG